MAAHARHDFDGAVPLLPAGRRMSSPRPARRRNAARGWSSTSQSASTSPSIEVTGNDEERKLALELVRDLAQR